MQDIHVIHDKVGVYSYWKFSNLHEGIQEPWLTRYWHDYFEAKRKPNYPVPAIYQCQWCASRTDVCDYNGDGYWCPSLCFELN